MRHYYYSDNEQQLGPFTLDELKAKRLKKSTLVWTDGLADWMTADKIEELKDILISEPPPLPKKETTKQTETVTIKETAAVTVNSKFDTSYQKETDATFVGAILFLTPIVIQLTGILKFDDRESYEQARMWIAVGTVAVRIGATVWAVNIAKRQNRNTTGWGWLTFFFPGIALIIIGQLRKLKLKIEIDGTLPQSQQVSTLLSKANELYSENRIQETIEVLNKVIELDNENYEAILLRAESLYQLEEYDKAKTDFTSLMEAEQFLDKSNLYLGILESNNYNFDKAIEHWKIAKENGNDRAQDFLDRYSSYKGKYLLNQTEINKKLGSEKIVSAIDFGHGNGQYLKGIAQADNISQTDKYKTEIILHQYGFRFKLSKLFKSYQFAVSYTEIEDIKQTDMTLNFILFDKTILSFIYDSNKDTNDRLKRICNNFTQETGIEPTAETTK